MAPPTGGVKGWKDLTERAPLPKKYLLLFDKAEWCRSRHRVRTWSYGLFISARGGVCGSSFILHAVLCYSQTISHIMTCETRRGDVRTDHFRGIPGCKAVRELKLVIWNPCADWSVMYAMWLDTVRLDMLDGSPPENGNLDPVRTEMPCFSESVCWKSPNVGPIRMFGSYSEPCAVILSHTRSDACLVCLSPPIKHHRETHLAHGSKPHSCFAA